MYFKIKTFILFCIFFCHRFCSLDYVIMGCQDFCFCFVCYRLTVLLLSHLVLFYQRADVLY